MTNRFPHIHNFAWISNALPLNVECKHWHGCVIGWNMNKTKDTFLRKSIGKVHMAVTLMNWPANFRQTWWELTDCNHHCSRSFTKNHNINLDGFSWFFVEIIHQMWWSFVKVDGSSWYNLSVKANFRRDDLRNLWILCQTNCQGLPAILHFDRVSPKKDVQPISIAFTKHSSWFYSHKCTS